MKQWIVYKHTSLKSGKSYVGQTSQTINKRWHNHLMLTRQGSERHFHRAIRLYGEDNWTHEVLADEIDTIEEATQLEIYWIKKLDTFENGYNLTPGGEGCPIGKFSKYPEKLTWYHHSKGEEIATAEEMMYLHDLRYKGLLDVLIGRSVHVDGWFLDSTKVYKVIQPIDKNTCITVYHDTYGKYEGTYKDFLKLTGRKPKEFTKLLKGKVRSTDGWRLTEEPYKRVHDTIYKYDRKTMTLVATYYRYSEVAQSVDSKIRKEVMHNLRVFGKYTSCRYEYRVQNSKQAQQRDAGDKQLGVMQ